MYMCNVERKEIAKYITALISDSFREDSIICLRRKYISFFRANMTMSTHDALYLIHFINEIKILQLI